MINSKLIDAFDRVQAAMATTIRRQGEFTAALECFIAETRVFVLARVLAEEDLTKEESEFLDAHADLFGAYHKCLAMLVDLSRKTSEQIPSPSRN